jgi:hypothetical protein
MFRSPPRAGSLIISLRVYHKIHKSRIEQVCSVWFLISGSAILANNLVNLNGLNIVDQTLTFVKEEKEDKLWIIFLNLIPNLTSYLYNL